MVTPNFRNMYEKIVNQIHSLQIVFMVLKPLSRIIVSLWGPLANIIFSLVLFFFIAWTGYEELYSEPRILLASNWNNDGKVWPADEAGLQDGDYILSIDGESIQRFSDLRNHYVNMSGKEIELGISRGSENFRVTAIPDGEEKSAVLGILNWLEPVIEEVKRNSPADRAGLISNDKILSLNKHDVQHTVALSYLLKRFAGSQVEIEVERNGSIETMPLHIPENKKKNRPDIPLSEEQIRKTNAPAGHGEKFITGPGL